MQTEKLIKIYMIYAILFGLLYMFIMPFPSAPDENRHFLKIYGMTEGVFFPSDSVSLPGNLDFENQYDFKYDKVLQDIDRCADYGDMHWYDLSSTTLYFPLVYGPQTLGMLLAKLFTHNIYALCFVARVFGYIFNVMMVLLAIRLMPFKKELIFMTAFLPIYMQESVSLAGDSVENALILVFVAYIMAMRSGGEKRIWPLFVMGPLIGLCKMFYLPMVLLVLLTDTGVREKIGVIAESLLLNGLWLLSASGQPSHYNSGADGKAQLKYIMSDLINYLEVLLRTAGYAGRTWLRQAMGGNLGWIAVNVFMPFILIYLLMMIYYMLVPDGHVISGSFRTAVILIDLAVFLIVATGEYLQWTKVGAALVDGIQGRYFVPLISVTMLCLINNKIKLPQKYLYRILFVYTAIYNVAALATVFHAYS